MNVDEVRLCKDRYEKEVYDMVERFFNETGVAISTIEITNRTDTKDISGDPTVYVYFKRPLRLHMELVGL
jgi:hypothetical protein